MKKLLWGLVIIIIISVFSIIWYSNQNATDILAQDKGSINMLEDNSSSINNDGSLSSEGQQDELEDKQVAASDKSLDESLSNNIGQNASGNTTQQNSGKAVDDAKEEKASSGKSPKSIVDKLLPDKVEDKIDAIAVGTVSATDILEVVKIVGGKLSIKEITFLFNSAKSDYWETTDVEDIEKARDILFSKLSDSDLDKLTAFGKKYGRSMDIIRKDLDVAETKENQMMAKGLK